MIHLNRFLSRLERVRRQGAGWRACCPVHEDSATSLMVSLGEMNRILFMCHACGKGRKPSEVILAAMGLAWRDTYAQGRDRFVKATIAERTVTALTDEEANLRHEAYTWLTDCTPLTCENEGDLLRRGMFRGHIHSDGYFSTDLVQQDILGKALLVIGEKLFAVPGFHKGFKGKPQFSYIQGLFIPVRDFQGRIISGQIRTDGEPKYLWLPGSGSPWHKPLHTDTDPTEVWITEGPLKADICSQLSGKVVLGVAGAAAWKPLIPMLTGWGVDKVVVAFDSDYKRIPSVERQRKLLLDALTVNVRIVFSAEWEEGLGKGLDDLLANGFKPTLRGWDCGGKSESRQGQPARA